MTPRQQTAPAQLQDSGVSFSNYGSGNVYNRDLGNIRTSTISDVANDNFMNHFQSFPNSGVPFNKYGSGTVYNRNVGNIYNRDVGNIRTSAISDVANDNSINHFQSFPRRTYATKPALTPRSNVRRETTHAPVSTTSNVGYSNSKIYSQPKPNPTEEKPALTPERNARWQTPSHWQLPVSTSDVSFNNYDSGTVASSDVENIKNSEHSRTTTCWIAAKHALQHVRNNISSVSEVFGRWKIQEFEYALLAGFDESLIKSGVGYLEQIHVFTIAEVDATSPLLSELGRLLSPFSSILFTETSSYHLPVFKDNGSAWEFDELVYYTASKFADGGSSAKTPLTIISFCQTTSQADGTTNFPPSGSGSGEGDKNEKQRLDKGKQRDMGDKDEANKGDKDPSGDPNNPPRDQEGIDAGPAISFEITSKMHLNESEQNTKHQDKQNAFQTLTMDGKMTIKTTPLAYNPFRNSRRLIQFTKLTFGTERTTAKDIAYKQIHLRIVIDSHQKNAEAEGIKTPHSVGEEKQSSSTKSGWIRGMSAALTLGPNPQGVITGTTMNTNEVSVGSEKTIHKSAISEFHAHGKVRWGFDIDDVNFAEGGFEIRDDHLPTVDFEFIGDSVDPEPSPTPPPDYMDIAITSYWKMIPPDEPKGTWIRRLLNFFKSNASGNGRNAQTASFFNLFQIVAFEANLSKLLGLCRYKADVTLNPGATGSNPHEVKIRKRPLKSLVNAIPALVDNPQGLIFSDESPLRLAQKPDESDPLAQKPSLPIRLPTIANFTLSDDCKPIWGNLCDSSKATTSK